jgi:hypothetical protein
MVVAKTIAKLGEDGWELVSATQDSNVPYEHVLFFKRPKE